MHHLQVTNMTKGDAGQNISKFASGSLAASKLTTSLPYVSYIDLAHWLGFMRNHLTSAVDQYFVNVDWDDRTIEGFKDYCLSSSSFADVFVCDGYRLCRAAKLLMALGYGNFSSVVQYDIYAMATTYYSSTGSWSRSGFTSSKFYLDFSKFESSTVLNSPNLSILPLLAYHKICNDHYRNEKWQPFEPWTCNIDYLLRSNTCPKSSV